MADIMRTSLSGLLAFQRALATTSNNVANANTEGYSRQRVEIVSRAPEAFGNGFVGNGVDVRTVARSYDRFAVNQYRSSNSLLGRLDGYAGIAGQVDDILGDSSNGLASGISSFFAAWQDVANNPSSITARQQLLAQAQNLGDQFRLTSQRLDQIEVDVNLRLEARVADINRLAASIARLNEDVEIALASFNGQPPNDLLDQRDQLLNELSQIVDVQMVEDHGGALNVFIGQGQSIVLRGSSTPLATVRNDFDPSRLDLVLQGAGGPQVVTQALSGGEVGGLLDVRRDVLDFARSQLGLVATALASTVNVQQQAGMDLEGRLGASLFSIGAPAALAATGNAGAAAVTAAVTGLAQLTGQEYELRFDGAAWQLLREPGRVPVVMTGAGTPANPFEAEGLSFVVTGAAAAGDRFLVRSTREAATTLRAVMTDPREIAAAAPIRTSASVANTGNASVSAGEVVDAGDPALLSTVDIQFTGSGTYSVNGSGSFAYTSGSDITINGWRIRITGTPVAGDVFRVQSNAGGVGDNRNALLMAGIRDLRSLQGGTTTVTGQFGSLVGSIGTMTRQSSVARDAQQNVTSASRERMLAASAVNLDEEAADLLRWQQAYQAAAKAIAVADTIFQSLLDTVRR